MMQTMTGSQDKNREKYGTADNFGRFISTKIFQVAVRKNLACGVVYVN